MRNNSAKVRTVYVATPLGRGGEGGIDRLMDAIARVFSVDGSLDLRIRFAPTRGRGPLALTPFFLGAFLFRMLGLKLIRRCHLLHLNVASNGSTVRKSIIAVAARVSGIPYIVHLHGALYREFYATASPARQRRIRRVFGRATRVLVLGEIWREFVTNELGVSPERVVVMPNAVPIPVLPHEPDSAGVVRILFLGRLGERKGLPILVEALALLRDRPGWRAVLAGDGEVAQTRRSLERLGITSCVEVPGWLQADQIEALIARSDVLVLPSFAENLPMSVVEGMAAGLAIVATPVGATSEIVHHEQTGILVRPGDISGLASALARLIENRALRDRLGDAAKAYHRENLEIGGYARRLLSLWREAAR